MEATLLVKGMVIVYESMGVGLLTGIATPNLSVKVISIVSDTSNSDAPGVLA